MEGGGGGGGDKKKFMKVTLCSSCFPVHFLILSHKGSRETDTRDREIAHNVERISAGTIVCIHFDTARVWRPLAPPITLSLLHCSSPQSESLLYSI